MGESLYRPCKQPATQCPVSTSSNYVGLVAKGVAILPLRVEKSLAKHGDKRKSKHLAIDANTKFGCDMSGVESISGKLLVSALL